MKITVDIDVDLKGYDGKRTLPTFYTEAATVESESFGRIGHSMVNPFVYFLFTEEGTDTSDLPNGGYLASVTVTDIFGAIDAQWDTIVAAHKEATS